MGTQIIEARNKIHRMKKTRKVGQTIPATSENHKVEQAIHRCDPCSLMGTEARNEIHKVKTRKVEQTIQPPVRITKLSKQFTGVTHALCWEHKLLRPGIKFTELRPE